MIDNPRIAEVLDFLEKHGLGYFAVQTRAQKTARNITRNTTVIIPEHKVPTFKPCPDFKNQVK